MRQRLIDTAGVEALELVTDMELLRALERNAVERQAGARGSAGLPCLNDVGKITSAPSCAGRVRGYALPLWFERLRLNRRYMRTVPLMLLLTASSWAGEAFGMWLVGPTRCITNLEVECNDV